MKTYTEVQAKKIGGIFTADELAELLNLLPYEDPSGGHCFYDNNYEYAEQTALGNYAYKRDLVWKGWYTLTSKSGAPIDVNAVMESANFEPFIEEALTESYRVWLRALETTANSVFERICTNVVRVTRKGENGIYDSFEIVPDWNKRKWKEIAEFAFDEDGYFNSLTEWTQNYGSTYRSAAIKFIENHGYQNWVNGQDVERKFCDYLSHYGG